MGIGLEETTPTKEPHRHVFARLISTIIHPIAFPLLTLGVVTYIATSSFAETSRWLLLAIVLCLGRSRCWSAFRCCAANGLIWMSACAVNDMRSTPSASRACWR